MDYRIQNCFSSGRWSISSRCSEITSDGQQRMTSLYGVVRGNAPKFFDGNTRIFTGLCFHLEDETFSFYQPVKMRDDPLWINVTELFQKGHKGIAEIITNLSTQPETSSKVSEYFTNISNLLGITDVDLHVEEVTGEDKTIDIIVEIFNRVNSGGTKLSKGDLALAKICADWPDARNAMKAKIKEWENADFDFNLDWLLRSINTVLTGEAKFHFLHDRTAEEIKDSLEKATKHINTCLNMISGRLGLDHDRVLFARYAIPVMVRYLDRHDGPLDMTERDKLLFWFVQSGMWGRFSGSTESYIDKDLVAFEGTDGSLNNLLEQLRLWHGGLRVEPNHFTGWSLGARFYPVLYLITRMGEARDWGTGLPLKANLLGRMNRLEVHHIFPKSQLYKHKLNRSQVNALGNYCFLTKDTNIDISNRLPEEYFPEIEAAHHGALASQWIPSDKELWKIDNYLNFLEARKILLAAEVNRRMEELLHGDTQWLEGPKPIVSISSTDISDIAIEEDQLEALNEWMEQQSLMRGILAFDFADTYTGEQKAVLDLAWPKGIQEGLGQPVAVILTNGTETLAIASQAGYRCFASVVH